MARASCAATALARAEAGTGVEVGCKLAVHRHINGTASVSERARIAAVQATGAQHGALAV